MITTKVLAAQIAKKVFDRRSRGKHYRTTEAHLGEAELAEILELAIETATRMNGQATPVEKAPACKKCGCYPGRKSVTCQVCGAVT